MISIWLAGKLLWQKKLILQFYWTQYYSTDVITLVKIYLQLAPLQIQTDLSTHATQGEPIGSCVFF